MILIAYIPALVCLFGFLAYVLSTKAKVVECGRIAYACGLIVTLYSLLGHAVRIG